jgi:hypothetical protein
LIYKLKRIIKNYNKKMNYENYDEEINEYNNEHDIYQEMDMKEIENVSDIKNKEIDENEKFNLPLTMENQKDYNKLNYDQNSFEYSLYKELEEKWSDIEKRKQLNLKRKNNDFLDSKINNIFTIDSLLNWKEIVYESRKKFNERKLRENENNDFDKFIKEKKKELNELKKSNINRRENPKDKIRNYFNKKGFNNYYNFDSLQKLTSNNLNNSNLKKSFLKEDEEEELINNKHIFFKITEDKIPLIKEKESSIKNKLRNLFGIITKDNKYIINNNIGDSKFSEMSIDDLDKNFEDIISDLSNDYKIKSKNLIFKRNKKHNLNKSYSINGRRFNSRNNIKKKFLENNILLNELLPESGIGNKKINSFNNNNNKLSFSQSRIIKDYNQLNRNQSYKIFKTNKYNSIINKFAGITSPKLSKLIH